MQMATCPACAQENPAAARFCFSCGRAIGGDELAPRNERRIVTVLFVDIAAFTSRAERLDPEDLGTILHSYHERVRHEIESFGGVTEKFIGDAVVGVFGAPIAYGDDPERAVRAALAVRTAIDELNRADQALDLHVRIGVNTGDALVTVGARPERGEAMVAGEVVNMAARLQQNAPVDGILAGLETYACTRDAVTYGEMISTAAKGKSTPLHARPALGSASRAEPAVRRPLVGREGEMQHLRQIWARAAGSATPHVVTVLAPPGIGKTRLSVEFSNSVKDAGGRVVRGRSLPYRESSAYGAFATQVKQLAGFSRVTRARSAAQSSAEPSRAWARENPMPSPATWESCSGSSQSRPWPIARRCSSRCAASSRRSQRIDRRCLCSRICTGPTPACSISSSCWARACAPRRSSCSSSPVRSCSTHGRDGAAVFRRIPHSPLQPLGADESRQLADELLGGPGGDSQSILAIHVSSTAEGNPLFIEQLAAVALERVEHALLSDKLPTTIRGIVTARLDSLPPEERSVLLNAAVVGKVFWRGALRAVIDDADQLGDILAALERRDLVRRDRQSAIECDQQYAFKHALIRDAAYDMLTRPQRRERHRRVAQFLEEEMPQAGEAAAQLARHWREAGDADRAVDHFVVAAEQAGRGWAKHHSVALYREALDLVPEGCPRHAEISRQFAIAYQASWHVQDVRDQRRGPDVPDPGQTSG